MKHDILYPLSVTNYSHYNSHPVKHFHHVSEFSRQEASKSTLLKVVEKYLSYGTDKECEILETRLPSNSFFVRKKTIQLWKLWVKH